MKESFPWGILRIVFGFMVAPVVASISYTLMSFGVDLFFPFIFYVLGGAFLATLLVFIPVYVVLLWRHWFSFWQVIGTASLVTFILFFSLFLISAQNINAMGAGNIMHVVDGKLTTAGYINILKGTALVTLAAAIGSVVFWLIAHLRLGDTKR